MSARSAKQTERILKERMPGYTLSPESSKYTTRRPRSGAAGAPGGDAAGGPRAAQPRVDSSTPSIADLRKKFLRPAADSDAAMTAAADLDHEDDADIVLVEPTHGPEGKRSAKAVVIDGEGRILGAQG